MVTSSAHRRSALLVVPVFLIMLASLIGCDPSVEVLNPSSQYRFSLFGTLDVARDTQIIRVEPLGDTTRLGAPPEIDARVYLENVNSGSRTELRDSFETVSGGIAAVHNFRTTQAIQPSTTYRIIVKNEEEAVTTASTTTPPQPPTLLHQPEVSPDQPFLLPCEFNARGNPIESRNTFSFRVRDVESIAAVKVIYLVDYPNRESVISRAFNHFNSVTYEEDGDFFRVSVFYGEDLLNLSQRAGECLSRSHLARPYAKVVVAAGGPDWPEWRDASLNAIARPDTFSNVKGGHGFVGGIYTDTLRVPVQARD